MKQIWELYKCGINRISKDIQFLFPMLSFCTPFMIGITLFLFVPQIIQLHEVKNAEAISLATFFFSFVIQLHALLLHAIGKQYQQFIILLCSMSMLTVVLFQILYYKGYIVF